MDQLVWYMERLFFRCVTQILVTKLPVLCLNFVSFVERRNLRHVPRVLSIQCELNWL